MNELRKEFEAWWEEFKDTHDEWRFADREALLLGAYQAAHQSREAEIAALREQIKTIRNETIEACAKGGGRTEKT